MINAVNNINLNDLSEQYFNFQREVHNENLKFSQAIKDNLLKHCEVIFNKNPQIKSFIWSQFTPYDHMTFIPVFNV